MRDEDELGAAETQAHGSTTQPSMTRLPPTVTSSLLAGRYDIQSLLGMGGMGRVYRAHDRTLDEVVALKVLRRELVGAPGAFERFRQEVKLARRVTNPHVVRTFDLGQHGDDVFLTMEYVEGTSLAQLLDLEQLSITEALRIARAACAGIAAAHQAGVLHRDLKPDNVLVARTGRIAITDFGIARIAGGPGEASEGFVGTPAYMAPEQVTADRAIGPPADVYAFGAVLFEMLAGRRPFVGTDPMAVATARLTEAAPDPRTFRDMPDALADLVLRCLAREPAARFADGAAIARALADIADRPTAAAATVISPIVPTKSSRSVAVLPLRASGDLVEIADGLSEEIVDALSMTRALRVRPLGSVRSANRPDADPRDVGVSLGVDVVVDGSVRRVADTVRITARVIGVADGFQLWANRFDTRGDGLLAAIDDVARAVARALTVEIDVPQRGAIDPRATELYLEGKAAVRANWMAGGTELGIDRLEEAARLAPDDPSILAMLAMAVARSAFFGLGGELTRARQLAERAVGIAPGDGESWLALGLACLYAGAVPDAGRAMARALTYMPGLSMAQALVGAMLLEAGAMDDARAHLEGAIALEPAGPIAIWDLARLRMYEGRDAEAFALLDEIDVQRPERHFAEMTIGRFHMWRGRRYASTRALQQLPSLGSAENMQYIRISRAFYETWSLPADDLAQMIAMVHVKNPRLRMSRAQFVVEHMCVMGDHADALDMLQTSVDAGLQDHAWMQRCPVLEPIRTTPRFGELAAIVADRAASVIAAIHDGIRST